MALIDLRSQFGQELQDPDMMQKLMASVNAEVGDQGPDAQLAYIESVMNRAAARGMTLDQTISDKGYYPNSTISKLGKAPPASMQTSLSPLINQALGGSNISNFATGNESGSVHSGGAPVTFNPGSGERFVLENPDKGWIQNAGVTAPSYLATGTTSAAPSAAAPAVAASQWGSPLLDQIRQLQVAQALQNQQLAGGGLRGPQTSSQIGAQAGRQLAQIVQGLRQNNPYMPFSSGAGAYQAGLGQADPFGAGGSFDVTA